MNIAVQQLVERARIHPSTARRWIRSGRRPWWLQALIECAGNLGILSQSWEGWSLHRDILRSPEGELFHPEDLRALRVMRGQIEAYRSELRFQLQADWVDGRYVNAEIVAAPAAYPPPARLAPSEPFGRRRRMPDR